MKDYQKTIARIKADLRKYVIKYNKMVDELSLTRGELLAVKEAKKNKDDLSITVNGKQYQFPFYKKMNYYN